MQLRRSILFLLSLCSLPLALFAAPSNSQRVIIADFEDVGTWRVVSQHGHKPGVWFAGDIWMGGSFAPAFADERAGELRFAFADNTNQQRRLAYRRLKMSRVSGFLNGIEFDADSRGFPISVRFGLLDSAQKRHWTPEVKLDGQGWKRYRIELNATRWPSISKVNFPASVEQVIIEADKGCEGSVLMDDLAITGTFPRRNRLSIFPLYSGIHHMPGESVSASYRIRNSDSKPMQVEVSAQLRTAEAAAKNAATSSEKSLSKIIELPAHGQAVASFDFGPLPVGAWSVRVHGQSVNDARVAVDYDDSFGVFIPNGSRINKTPMWFGVQDTTPWNVPAENALHIEWMRTIGFDINRLGISGHRFMPEAPASIEAWRPIIDPFEKAGIDSVVLFGDTPPKFIQKGDNRLPPNDLVGFEKYSAELGRFLRDYSSIKYIEFWNEPDIDFYHGTLEEYWDMFGAFSRGFRSTAPKIKITTGGATIRHPREKPGFNRGLYTQHGDLYDVAAFHAHGTLSNYTQRHRQVEEWLASAGLNKRIANTESGERTGYELRGEFEQALTLIKKLAWAKAQPNSEFHIWFTIQDYWDMDPDADDSFGLITSDNRAKPALVAYNELIRQLANTKPTPRQDLVTIEKQHGVTLCEFTRDDGKRVIVCWAAEGASGGALWIRAGKSDVSKISPFGESETLVAGSDHIVPVGTKPLYLISNGPEPLRILSEDEREINAPAEIFRDAAEPAPVQVVVRNTRAANVVQMISVRDEKGAVIVTRDIRLAPSSKQAVTLVLPPAATSSIGEPLTYHYTLELIDAAGSKPVALVPLIVHESYTIVREGGAASVPLRLRTAQDITELAFDPTIPVWRGPDDLSVEARVSHDSGNVIFRFDVTDDKHVQTGNSDSELWRSDSIQIAFYIPATAAHTLFDLGLVDGNRAVVWCYRSTGNPALGSRAWSESEVPRAIRREGNRTRYEVRVPYSMLGLSTAGELSSKEGIPVRFAFLVNENDGRGRVRWMRWRGGLGNNQDIAPLGHAILK